MIELHKEEFEKELKAFEEGLYVRFKKQFDLNASFFRQLSDVIDRKMNTIKPQSDFQWAITFLFYRSYKLYWTILILCQKGFGPEAGILLRSLMEQVINMEWIAKENSDQRAKLFLEYFHVARKKLYDLYDKYGIFPKLTDAEKEFMESREEIERVYKSVKNNYQDERYWAPETIRSRANQVGAGYDFDFYYWHTSFLTHASSACQIEYLKQTGSQSIFVLGPSDSMIKDVLFLSYKYFLIAVKRWNVVFELKLDNLVLDLSDKLAEISVIRAEEASNSHK
jgi:hypothetical protein